MATANLIKTGASTSSASASSSAADLVVGEYEVFLSFRGADTRYGFTDFLYTDLVGAGVCTFRDDNELRVGEEIGPELLRAIKESKISIPIFSKNYASSKWCLRELAQMVEFRANGGCVIYPIFYDVEPSDVQHQRGSYEEAFLQYDKSLDEKTVQQWREALEIVGDLKGLELEKETKKREGELVKIVVEKVLLKLKKNYKHVPENLVGIDHHIEELKGLLNSDSNGVRIIGILGMGGLGKTTIAKVIYNQLCELFECHCFLEDVRENSNCNGIVNLQNQLLSKILKREISKCDDVNEGIDKIKGAIHGKKVFIVLDDVDDKFQIEKLAVNHNWYGAGSRIIITTRNEEVLAAIEVTCQNEGLREVYMSYKLELMEVNHALQLFSKYAFMRDSPPEDYDILAREVIRYAAGLPLVLVTLGSLLFIEKDKGSWQEKLKKLKEIPRTEVLERLRISYDALDYEQKQIFLDIACFFAGVDKTNPCYMWDDCEFYPLEGINALVRRSLITVRDDNTLRMHDHLRDLGRQIVYEENNETGERSRLWRHKEALNIVETHLGTKKVKALCLDFEELAYSENGVRCLVGEDFFQLPNLRYLAVDNADLDGDFKHLFLNLRWLHWRGCSENFTPTNFQMKNLVILDLSPNKITDDWEGWSQIKMSKKLKVLNLWSSEHLSRALQLSTFSVLERLCVAYCSSLSRLDGLEHLESLRCLDASVCISLEELPNLSKLRKLEILKIFACEKLVELQGLDRLESLEVLNISKCISLERLPNLSNLEKLKTLNAYWCWRLIEIQGLDRLGSLEMLDMSFCTSLKRLPDLSNLKGLKQLYTRGWRLIEIPGLGRLESLEHLDTSDHKGIERLSDLSNLNRLRELKTRSCLKLIEIHGLEGLKSLEHLDMHDCGSIRRLPKLSNLKSLKRLDISSCHMLIKIQDLDGLESLEYLDMSNCKSLERLPDLSSLQKLKELNMKECFKLVEIQGLDRLKSLEHLDMRDCISIERLPVLPNLGMLKSIFLSYCRKLHSVESLRAVESLEILNMSHCKALGKILDLPKFKNLKRLILRGLHDLTEIRGLEELKSLQHFAISGCKSIENLPDFSSFKNLGEIDVFGCTKLTEIRGIEELNRLFALDIRGCESLNSIPKTNSHSYIMIKKDY